MDFAKQIVLSFVEKIFDEPKKKKDNLIEYEFNCLSKTCSHDHNKFNLCYNININKFHCWKCNYRGGISDLLKDYGTEDDFEIISSVVQDIKKEVSYSSENKVKKDLFLPESFCYLKDCDNNDYHYKNALKYLSERGIGKKEIDKFKLGYAVKGKYRFRIVVPSFDKEGKLNYFDCRSFYPNIKPNYLKPDKNIIKKFDIIFNESNVSFYSPIYLVEGVFDMFPVFNCVPMLGKKINNVLLNKIIKHKTPVVICLDEDAVSDVIKMFEILNSFGIDVYWCPIKDDLAKIYEEQGKVGIVKTLSGIKKMDMKTIMELKMNILKIDAEDYFSKEDLKSDWELIKKTQSNG